MFGFRFFFKIGFACGDPAPAPAATKMPSGRLGVDLRPPMPLQCGRSLKGLSMGKSVTGLIRQSAVVPFRKGEKKWEILLITSRETRRLIVPKGMVERKMSAAQSALNEAYEEAGLRGRVVGPALGQFDYWKLGKVCRVTVFPMRVHEELEDWPEKAERTRLWVAPGKAAGMVDDVGLGVLIRVLHMRLKKGKVRGEAA